MARREKRAYREYVSDEQRSQARGPQRGSRVGVEEGCIGVQSGTVIRGQVLSPGFPCWPPGWAPVIHPVRVDANVTVQAVRGVSAVAMRRSDDDDDTEWRRSEMPAH